MWTMRAACTDRMHFEQLVCRLGLRTGHFVLRSGRATTTFLDLKPVCQHPAGFELVGRVLTRLLHMEGWRVDALAGPVLGGVAPALAAMTFALRHTDHFWPVLAVRVDSKDHGAGERVAGAAGVAPGASLVVIEDVVTTGAASRTAVAALRAAGYEPVGVLALVDRSRGQVARRLAVDGLVFSAVTTLARIRARQRALVCHPAP